MSETMQIHFCGISVPPMMPPFYVLPTHICMFGMDGDGLRSLAIAFRRQYHMREPNGDMKHRINTTKPFSIQRLPHLPAFTQLTTVGVIAPSASRCSAHNL